MPVVHDASEINDKDEDLTEVSELINKTSKLKFEIKFLC